MSAFTEKDWQDALSNLAAVIGDDARRYENVPAAKLFAALPFLADSEDPDRFAVSNLLTFYAATKARNLFDHRPGDDENIFRRLAAFHVGNKADHKAVDYGLTLLALISLGVHEHDAEADRTAGKYNPLNAGKWDAAKLRKELEADLEKSPALKEAFTAAVGSDVTSLGWWTT